eukprot:195552-Pyramimonas_sp.AAC.1
MRRWPPRVAHLRVSGLRNKLDCSLNALRLAFASTLALSPLPCLIASLSPLLLVSTPGSPPQRHSRFRRSNRSRSKSCSGRISFLLPTRPCSRLGWAGGQPAEAGTPAPRTLTARASSAASSARTQALLIR